MRVILSGFLGFCVSLASWLPAPTVAANLDTVVQAHDRLESVMGRIAIAPPYSGSSATRAIRSLTSVTSADLARGWIARAAIDAANAPQFAESIRRVAQQYGSAKAYALQLTQEPRRAFDAERAGLGMRAAYDRISINQERHTWLARAMHTISVGRRPGPLPLSLMPVPKSKPGNQDGFFEQALSRSGAGMPAWSAGSAGNPGIAERMMALGAIRALGLADDPELQAPIDQLLTSYEMYGCIDLMRLNLSQCQSANHAGADTIFCLGEHAIGEAGRCFSWILPSGY